MPTRRISFRTFQQGLWLNGPRENVPETGLRRAAGIYPLRGGSILSRSPMTTLFTLDAHSLFKFASKRFAGVATLIYKDGVLQAAPAQNGNRLSWLEIPAKLLATGVARGPQGSDFLFVSGGGAPFKLASTTLTSKSNDFGGGHTTSTLTAFTTQNWGIYPPTQTMLTAIGSPTINAPSSTSIEPFDALGTNVQLAINNPDKNTDEVDISGNSDSPRISIDTVRFVEGTGSLRMQAPANYQVEFRKALAGAPIDVDSNSTQEDYIEFFIRCNHPKNVDKIEIQLYVGTAPFVPATPGNNFFHREFSLKLVRAKKKKRTLRALGDLVPDHQAKTFLQNNAKANKIDDQLHEFLDSEYHTIAVTKHSWTRVTLPKVLWDVSNPSGTDPRSPGGFSFANVIGVGVVVQTNNLGGAKVWVDGLQLLKGVGTRGDYKYTFTFRNDVTGARSNPPIDQDGNIRTLSVQGLDRNSVTFNNLNTAFPAASIPGFPTTPDPQVTHVELWRTIGNGGLVFFFAGMFPVGATSITDTSSDYIGMHSDPSTGVLDPTQQLSVDNAPMGVGFRTNYLTPAPSSDSPVNPDPTDASLSTTDTTDVITRAVYHAPSGRVFALSANFPGRLLYSQPGRPESIAGFIEPSTPDDPLQNVIIWSNNLYVFSQKHVFEVVGTDEPFVAVEAFGSPGTTHPFAISPTPFGLCYFARDGERLFDGQTSKHLGDDQLAPIFRGGTVDGGAELPFTGLVSAYGRSELYVSDGSTTTYAFDFRNGAWRNVGIAAKAFYFENDTGVLQASAIEPPGCANVGMWNGIASGAPGTDLTIGANGTYFSLATNTTSPSPSTTATIAQAQAMLARAVTMFAFTLHLNQPIANGHSLIVALNLNGGTAAITTVTFTPGDQVKTVTFSVSANQFDLICAQIVAANVTTEKIRSFSVEYSVGAG